MLDPRTLPIDGAIGRPFLVDDAARVAPTIRRVDWTDAVVPDVAQVPVSLRADLAQRWTAVAQMEHASIAAFARFSLQLLALGAPADLVERTNQALVDETAHARSAFALASAYAGRPVGPDRLATGGALGGAVELAEVVRLVVREGCVGETIAAIEASEAEGRCIDPVVRRVLARIAVEEGRHAELAWRTVRWALDTGDPAVIAVLADELALLETEVEVAAPPTTSDADDRLLAWGCATDGLRAVLRASAVERVVLPALGAMLADAQRRAA